jgi:molybdate transport system permease protein
VNRVFSISVWLASAVALAFLTLPVLAIFLRVPPVELIRRLDDRAVRDALIVTAKTTLVAQTFILALGTPAAFLLATRRFRGRSFVISLVELPLVLPPAVAGLGLFATFGRLGLLGSTLSALGVQIALTQAAVVLAVAFVAGPFYVRTAIAAFAAVDPDLPAAARTLGAGPARTFFRVWMPLAVGGLGAGTALSFARGIGEFGATIMFAGSLQGVTQTLSLAIYEQFDVDFDVALSLGALLVVLSLSVLLVAKLAPTWTRSRSTSPGAFASSISH